ncbi:zinc finger protein 208-like [Myripristis murdjan]|uniref:zinc finger protein 208-like n=1 Tax=Myripristis murdjan TaxID=586833 RepID=UPI001176301B|nr:zinc finger protein 208-like [Myripristis murdjan]XP_029923328.1 zinc finger protein 208-like [Myripristis murdjan]
MTMDEVITQMNEEVAKHDSSTEALPTPLLIILSPPPPFLPVPGEPTMSWDSWHKSFENYLEAFGETELFDSAKCALLQNCLGQEGQRVYATLIQGDTTYAAATSALTVHFSSANSPQTHQLKFQQRAQRHGETVEQFVSALERLVKPCNFGDLQERLVLNQLIEKTNCMQLRERLLVEKETLTLTEALAIGKKMESSLNESASLGIPCVSVDSLDTEDHPVQRVAKRRRGRPRGSTKRKKTEPPTTGTTSSSFGHKYSEYYYGNDREYYSSGDENCGNETDEEECDKAKGYEGGCGNEEKVVISQSKTKGNFCPICVGRSFVNANKLARHMRTHTKEKPFSCPICAMTFSQSYHMTRHLRNQHSAGQYVCSKCGTGLKSWAELADHRRTHCPELLSCPDCDKKFEKSSLLTDHIKSHSEDHSDHTGTHRSRKCDGLEKQQSHNNNNYSSNERNSSGRDENETDNCSDKECAGDEQTDADCDTDDAKDKESEVGHEMKDKDGSKAKSYEGGSDNEKVVNSKSKAKGHFCPICVDRSFVNANKLARHMRTHTKDKPFSCPICAMTFSQSYHMTRHLRNQHSAGQYVCSKCGEDLKSWAELADHKRTHCPELLSCPGCDKKFEKSRLLTDHIKSHSEDHSDHTGTRRSRKLNRLKKQQSHNKDDYSSNEKHCGGRDENETHNCSDKECAGDEQTDADCVTDDAKDKGSEVDHEMKDKGSDEAEGFEGGCGDEEEVVISKTKTDRHFCPICVGRSFVNANKLARHMRTHTKEKPFSCPICALTFSQSYHMTRHLRNQHSAGQYVCSKCGKGLKSWAELADHKRTHCPELLSCPDCDKKFEKSSLLTDHIKSHSEDHSDHTGTRRSQKCDGLKKQQSHNKDNYSSNERNSSGRDENETDNCSDKEGGELTNADVDTDDAQDKGTEIGHKIKDKDCGETKSNEGGSGKEKVVNSKSKTKGHFCPICVDRRFRGANKLARHMRAHTKEKPFSCPVCAMTFSQSYHMTRHVRNQHSLSNYICSKCGASLRSWEELKSHMRTHVPALMSCPECDKKFKYKSALVNHIRTHNKIPPNPLCRTCNECGKIFSRKYHLKRHIETHGKSTKTLWYNCPDCQKSYSVLKNFNKHLEDHQKEKNGTCLKCDQTFPCPEELKAHMEIHKTSYPCAICDEKFKEECELRKHEQVHTKEEFYCSLCDKHFSKLSHYKRHVMVHARRESKCPHCESVFLQLTALKYHLRTHTEERPYQCTCCIETFTKNEDLERHCLKHRKFKKAKPYSCTRCDYAFSTLTELTEHMSSHKGEQPMNCPDCGKTFLNKNKLQKHLSIHTGERPHLCSLCAKGFPSAASLKLHVLIHTGDKPFKCSQCSKSFSSSSGLRLHGRQHMAVRPSYPCPDCGRTYGRMTELKMHQRYHTGDKPYSCTCCNKRFVSKHKLNVHMRIHTGERPYACSHCGQTFTQTGDRNRHMNKYHK